MKRIMTCSASVLLLLLSSPSWAAWHACENSANTIQAVKPNQPSVACYNFTATGASGFVSVAACATISVSLFPDTSGSTGTAEAYLYSCPTTSTNGCKKILGDTDGDGLPNDVTLTGDPTARRFGLSDIAPQYIYGDVTAASTSFGRLQVVCKP